LTEHATGLSHGVTLLCDIMQLSVFLTSYLNVINGFNAALLRFSNYFSNVSISLLFQQ